MKRTLMILMWMVATFVGWLVFVLGGLLLLIQSSPDMLKPIARVVPAWVFLTLVCLVGPVCAVAVIGYLGLRGRLPGTKLRSKQYVGRSFPVVPAEQAGVEPD